MKDLYLNGDVDFLTYGGIRFCTKEETEFWIEVVQQPPGLDCGVEFGEGEAKWTIYRCNLERFQVVEQDNHLYLVSCNWTSDWSHALPQYDEWFHKYLAPAAEHHGITLQELREQFCSEDPRARAAGLVTLGQYLEREGGWGGSWENFDSYPLSLGEHEVYTRYAQQGCCCKVCDPEAEGRD